MAESEIVGPKLVTCIVCGAGSHRDDWQDTGLHACVGHSKVEVAQARSKYVKAVPPVKQPAPPVETAVQNPANPTTPAAPPVNTKTTSA